MSALGDAIFLELFRSRLDEIRELVANSSPNFIREAHDILFQIVTLKASDDRSRLVSELIHRGLETGAADLVRQLVSEANPQDRTKRSVVHREALDLLKIEQDAAVSLPSAAATLWEWMTPTHQYQYRSVPVFFATDRMPSGDKNPNKFFGGQRGPLSYGVVRVSIPDRHKAGKVERPWKMFPESPTKHVTLLGLMRSDSATFSKSAREALEATPAKKLLLFVHGYNVPFAEACRVLAQITFDMNFSSIPVLYSWPSKGTFLGYIRDEANAGWTREHFLETLNVIGAIPAEQHLLAHSMGCRISFQGLQVLRNTQLKEVILAAPDEDAGTMEGQLPRFLGRAERSTLYWSTQDRALSLSRWLHGATRGGQSGVGAFDSIDASAVNFSQFGHSYFHDQRLLLNDIFLLVEHGLPPDRRPAIRPSPDRITWVFQP